MSVERIQSRWRVYNCRKKIKHFSQLPTDLWYHILHFLTVKAGNKIDAIISLRVTRMYWVPPSFYTKTKLHTMYLIKKYSVCLDEDTRHKSLALCLRLLEHSRPEIDTLLINATLETLLNIY
jgi:hypothetical protein